MNGRRGMLPCAALILVAATTGALRAADLSGRSAVYVFVGSAVALFIGLGLVGAARFDGPTAPGSGGVVGSLLVLQVGAVASAILETVGAHHFAQADAAQRAGALVAVALISCWATRSALTEARRRANRADADDGIAMNAPLHAAFAAGAALLVGLVLCADPGRLSGLAALAQVRRNHLDAVAVACAAFTMLVAIPVVWRDLSGNDHPSASRRRSV